MKAFVIDSYKSKEGMVLRDVATPKVGDGDVLVEIHATSANLLDARTTITEVSYTTLTFLYVAAYLVFDSRTASESP